MTTTIPIWQGAPHQPTFDTLHLTWMPDVNWGEVATRYAAAKG